jgi:NlpC/P60 family putative phage cell wall peptidase
MNHSEHIAGIAQSWIGTPYQHQASLKGIGCDCLGLVRGVWRERLGNEPESPPAYSASWAESNPGEQLAEAAGRHMNEVPYTELQQGDLLLFRWMVHLPAKHAGIAVARDRMVHAQDGHAVTEIWLSPWWLKRLAFVFRFPESLG